MPSIALENRSVLRVAGPESRPFLQGLFTCDVDDVTPETPGFGALLTPQGKIIADFLLFEIDDGFFIDTPWPVAAELLKRLKMYRLRAKLEIEDASAACVVGAAWDGGALPPGAIGGPDPRAEFIGERFIAPAGTELGTDEAAYLAHRISCGVPEGGVDFAYGDTFPHDANMDLLFGVDFRKGCYVGQEVVSRVEHRGTARKRIRRISYETDGPQPGTPVMAGEIEVGTTGSISGEQGLAQLRIDRVAEARAAGTRLSAAGKLLVRIE